MSGYYPHATGALGYKSPRPQIGDKQTWSQLFKDNGYWAGRVSKIYHMGVPGGIEDVTTDVSRPTRSEVEPRAPLGRVVDGRGIGALGRAAEPEVPVEVVGRFLGLLRTGSDKSVGLNGTRTVRAIN